MLQKRCHQLASSATTASVTRSRLERPTIKHVLDVCYQHVTKLQQTSSRESLTLDRLCALDLAIRKLPSEQRKALRLYLRDDMQIRDVARRMGLTFATARRRLDRAREEVKRILRDSEKD